MNSETEKNQLPLESPEEVNLRIAAEQYRKAQERVAAAQQAKVDAAIATAAAERARREREAADAKARHLKIEEEIRARRQKQEDERKAAQKEIEIREENLRAAADKLRIEQQERETKQSKARAMAESARLLELEANRIIQEVVTIQNKPIEPSPADPTPFVENNNLAFDVVRKGLGAADDHYLESRARLFHRTAQQQQIDHNVDSLAQPQATVEYQLPEIYKVVAGKLADSVFKKLFGASNPFPLFLNGNGELCANGYKWRTESPLSRNFTARCQCTIEQLPSGDYVLTSPVPVSSGLRERVLVTLLEVEPLFRPAPLTEAELRGDEAVDQDEEILGDLSLGIVHSRNEAVLHG